MKKLKKTAAMLLILALAMSLCACGGSAGGGKSEAPANMESTLPGTVKDEQPKDAPEEQADPLEEIRVKVLALKDHPVEELYEAIGRPEKSDYAPSCLGPGEDGMLYYDGFTVYTYKEGDSEVVYDVE